MCQSLLGGLSAHRPSAMGCMGEPGPWDNPTRPPWVSSTLNIRPEDWKPKHLFRKKERSGWSVASGQLSSWSPLPSLEWAGRRAAGSTRRYRCVFKWRTESWWSGAPRTTNLPQRPAQSFPCLGCNHHETLREEGRNSFIALGLCIPSPWTQTDCTFLLCPEHPLTVCMSSFHSWERCDPTSPWLFHLHLPRNPQLLRRPHRDSDTGEA